MDYLWTPWRYQYVTKTGEPVECVFCAAPQIADDRVSLIVHRAQHNYVILNRYPYTSGHLMVVPYAHVATLAEVGEAALTEMMLLARDCEERLRAVYRPEGFIKGDFSDALEKIALGAARKLVLTPADKRRTAYHEAGHALVGMLTPGADPVRKISIIPRTMSLGVTISSPGSDRGSSAERDPRSALRQDTGPG